MDAKLVTIKNSVFEKDNGSEGKSVNLDIETLGNNSDDAEQFFPPGFYCKPHNESQGILISTKGQNILVANQNYNYDKDTDNGNPILYSIDSDGNIKGTCEINQDGEFVINDGVKSAVSYEALNSALQTLVTAINATFGTKLNGTGSPGTLTLDISASEVDKVKLP